MNEGGHRVVSFADQVVGVEWSGQGARQVVESVFGADADGDDRLPDTILRVGARPALLTLFHGRTCVYRGDSPGTTAHLLMQATLDSLIRKVARGIVLHTAVLGRGERGLLLPGASGSGKTMLSAWLASRGFDHLSDEAGYLADDQVALESFARPFCFKGAWRECLGLEVVDERRLLHDGGVTLVPTDLLNPAPRRRSIVPRLIVFPRFVADAPLELNRLTPARAAIRLLETVANARLLSDLGAARVTALVRNLGAYSLTYGRFSQLQPLLELVESLP